MTMTIDRTATHTRWQLLALVPGLAGLWLIVSPFVLDFPGRYPHQPARLVAILTGALVLLLSIAQGLWWSNGKSPSRGVLLLGLWLLVSPLVFDYWQSIRSTGAAVNSLVTGLVIVAGAGLCLAAPDV